MTRTQLLQVIARRVAGGWRVGEGRGVMGMTEGRGCRYFHVSQTGPETEFLEVRGEGGVRHIAYQRTRGPRTPGVLYIPGFLAHKAGTKPQALAPFLHQHGFPYVRYDPSGLGESSGVGPDQRSFSLWLDDAAHVLNEVTEGPQLVIGSSMGCWITSILAARYPEKFACCILLAPAFNFARRYMALLKSQLPPKLLSRFESGVGVKLFVPDYGDIPITRAMFEDMVAHEAPITPNSIPITVPTRIIHGVQDKDVPYKESLRLVDALASSDVQLLYVKHGGHQLHDPASLDVIFDTVLKITSPKPVQKV